MLESGYVSEGEVVAEFERRLVENLGLTRPVTVNSGTSAIHLALSIAGIVPGDEVVVPAQTFIATAQAVLMCGAKPVFADVCPDDGNMSVQGLINAIGPRCKAVIPVHWAGYPCDMDGINRVASEAGITVIEDAAHALGAIYKGRPVGTISAFTAFSFQAIKHLTTGDGGALCCLDQANEHKAKALRWFGIDRSATKPNVLGERDYDLKLLGFKYHMNNIAAAMGIGNLKTLKSRLAYHRTVAASYSVGLANTTGLKFPNYEGDRESSWWFYPLLVENRKDFVRAMQSRGVTCSVVHRRIDTNSLYKKSRVELRGQDEFDRVQINLPIHVGLSSSDVEDVVTAVKKGW